MTSVKEKQEKRSAKKVKEKTIEKSSREDQKIKKSKTSVGKKAKVVEKTPATDNKLKTPTKQRKRSKSIKDQSLEEIKEEEHEQTFRVGNEYA